ncbi:MAG: calcium-binding protein, partial [Halocynthiibacter sp.]
MIRLTVALAVTRLWGGGNDTITGDDNDNPVVDRTELITNGDFSNGLTAWSAIDANGDGNSPIIDGTGQVVFNNGTTPVGDAVEQAFTTTAGVEHTVSLDLSEDGPANATHTFRIEILDANGDVIAFEEATAFNESTTNVNFTFTPLTGGNTIRVTNVDSSRTSSTDGFLDNVSILATGPDLGYNDFINAGAGDDVVEGNAGDDTIDGGAGNDTIDGGTGNDQIQGGDGN